MRTDAVARLLGGSVLVALVVGAFLWSRTVVGVLAGLLFLAAYAELRSVLANDGRRVTLGIGALGTAAFLWVGHDGRLARLPWVAAALVLALLVVWVVFGELSKKADGAADDIGGTLAAAGVVGVFGAHVLLVRATERVGVRGLIMLGVLVVTAQVSSAVVTQARARKGVHGSSSGSRTRQLGSGVGVALATAGGAGLGLVLDPPFDALSGALFGLGVGVLLPVAAMTFDILKSGTQIERPALRPLGGALDVLAGLLFVAPPYYWAFRTISL